jgi:hypothetical protein
MNRARVFLFLVSLVHLRHKKIYYSRFEFRIVPHMWTTDGRTLEYKLFCRSFLGSHFALAIFVSSRRVFVSSLRGAAPQLDKTFHQYSSLRSIVLCCCGLVQLDHYYSLLTSSSIIIITEDHPIGSHSLSLSNSPLTQASKQIPPQTSSNKKQVSSRGNGTITRRVPS